jgi:hypothetical protein
MIFETWTSFELLMTAFGLFDAIMLIFMLKALKGIRAFNRDLHAVLLQSQEAQLRSHLHMRIQSPIKVWREIEQPPTKYIEQESMTEIPKKKIKKTVEPVTEPEEPAKIVPKTIQPCESMAHKWVMDKEKNYYCEKCGARFAK